MTTTSIHDDHDRNRRRFGKADDELVGWFSAAIGVKAQNLDSNGGAFNSHDAHEGRLKAMAWLSGHVGSCEWFDRVAKTIARLEPGHRTVLVTVYTPHAAPTWLQDALSPPWGGGSFVQLACALPRASLAARDRVDGRTVGDWLATQGRGGATALLKHLKEDSEALRMPVLAAYEALRIARIKAEQVEERRLKGVREEKNAKRYLELCGVKRSKDRARRARRTGIAA